MTYKKLRQQTGTTLVEMLAAVVVLVLVSMMVNTGLQMALKYYHSVTCEAEIQQLLSTAVSKVTDELRYAQDVVADEDSEELTSFTSRTFGEDCVLKAEDGRLVILEGTGDDAVERRLLASGAYGKDGAYQIDTLTITYDAATAVFKVELWVSGTGGEPVSAKVKVSCLNGYALVTRRATT